MAEFDGKSSEDDGEKGFMLFGVKVLTEGSFRKSASMNNLAQFDSHQDDAGGYNSDDVAGNRDRKRGVPWSEEEHRLFLLGLQKVGKGDWRGISRNYVKTRTPTQVASHAQKYFLRQSSHTRRRRRSSLFDITTDSVMAATVEDNIMAQPQPSSLPQNTTQTFEILPLPSYPAVINPYLVQAFPQLNNTPMPIRPIPLLPPSSKLANMNLSNTTTNPNPSLQSSHDQQPASKGRHASAFQSIPGSFKDNGGDGIISVA